MGMWIIKALFQKAISLFPKSYKLNYFFQKHITGNAELTSEIFEKKLRKYSKHIENYSSFSKHKKANARILELGTGRWPIIPLAFFLCGYREIWTVDVSPLVLRSSLKATLDFFLDYSEDQRLWKFLPMASRARIEDLRNALKMIDAFGVFKTMEKLHVHAIVEKSGNICPGCHSIDLIVSNNTFEHIPQSGLLEWLKAFKKILSTDSVMSHFVDSRDHYWYFDTSISPLNFLKYSDEQWKLFSNGVLYQNRLMISDYVKLHNDSGFEVLLLESVKAAPEDIELKKLTKKYLKYPMEELEVLEFWIVSKFADEDPGELDD